MLYLLYLTDSKLSYNNFSEDFFISVFETEEKAINVAKYYLKNIKGFCDYPCEYHIQEKAVIGSAYTNTIGKVWLVQGWNNNESSDEIDLIDSDFFLTEKQANKELISMQSSYIRDEWVINSYVIGELNWRPANKSQDIKLRFHKTFTESRMGTTKRPPKQSKKLILSATLTEHHKNAVVVVPTVRNS